MPFSGWEKITLALEDETECKGNDASSAGIQLVEAIAPVIISASRATDIPAFYADWFMHRLRKGYVMWVNPYSHRCQYISFARTRVIVFWTKDPHNLEKFLPDLDATGINYYFQFTLNDYENERLEPGVPPIEERIKTFIRLSEIVGKERVIWRFDPLLLSDTLTVDELILRIKRIGDKIRRHTTRFVFSFIDIGEYRKVKSNLEKTGFTGVREFSYDEKRLFGKKLEEINQEWMIPIYTCAEDIDLSDYNIRKGRCIDYDLISSRFSRDKVLMDFLHPQIQTTLTSFSPEDHAKFLKDPGQREACGCIWSKDIGQYNTCVHLCTYCYANHSVASVLRNYERYLQECYSGHFSERIAP